MHAVVRESLSLCGIDLPWDLSFGWSQIEAVIELLSLFSGGPTSNHTCVQMRGYQVCDAESKMLFKNKGSSLQSAGRALETSFCHVSVCVSVCVYCNNFHGANRGLFCVQLLCGSKKVMSCGVELLAIAQPTP